MCNYLQTKKSIKPEKTQPYDTDINILRWRWSFMDDAVSEHVEPFGGVKNKTENNNVKKFLFDV